MCTRDLPRPSGERERGREKCERISSPILGLSFPAIPPPPSFVLTFSSCFAASASGQARRFMQRQSSRSSLNGYESSTSAADIRDDGMDSPADLSPITPLFQRYSLPHSSQSFPCPLGSCVRPDPSLLSTRLVHVAVHQAPLLRRREGAAPNAPIEFGGLTIAPATTNVVAALETVPPAEGESAHVRISLSVISTGQRRKISAVDGKPRAAVSFNTSNLDIPLFS
eukprot:scaffold91934_cov35-Tisochrysis_lutea.AAC.1